MFALAFHVDYWNMLGWTDPFSRPQYSQRQRRYARQVRPRQVYTPQMIVNGTRKFVGSDRAAGQAAIAAALEQPATAGLHLAVRAGSGSGEVRVTCRVVGAPAPGQLHLALVERGIVRDIGAGENAGRRLRHENIVRRFITVTVGSTDRQTVDLPVPDDLVRAHASIIGYVQHPESMRILGAARVDLQ